MRIPSPADPFRPADWRHRRGEALLDLGLRPSRRRDDAPTWEGWHYLDGLRRSEDDRGRDEVVRRYPALDAAHQLRCSQNELVRAGLEGYLLAGVTVAEIDARLCLIPGVAQAFSEQFFDVLGRLGARDHLINVVIGLHRRPPAAKDVTLFCRLFGLMAGRHVLDAVRDYFANPPALPFSLSGLGEEERRLFRQRLQVHAAILTRCLPEGGVKPWTWELLARLADRAAPERAEASSGVRLDVAGYLARMDPKALGVRERDPIRSASTEGAT